MLQYIPNIKALVVLITLVSLANIAWSQQAEKASISGKINATSGEALVGVSVVLKGTTYGSVTDSKGRFEINNLLPGNYTLQISFVGFEIQEKVIQLKPAQKAELNISLRDKTYEMQGVEIVGKSETRQINEQPYAVTAISVKELQNSSQDAKEVLNRVSGVRVLEEGGLGSRLNFSLNGFSGDQVKFFLDGLPMDNFGSSLSMSDIPVNSIDRIEVYKGVVPVWLGTDALGGAVNIITNKKANFLDASYSIGSFNTHRISLNGAHTHDSSGFTVRGNANYNYSDNNYKIWVPINDRLGNVIDSAETERFHDRYRSGLVKMEAGWVNRKFADNLLFGIMAAANDKQIQTGATMNNVYGGVTRTSQSIVPTFKFSKDDLFIKGLNLSLFTAYNRTKSEIADTLAGVKYNWLGERFSYNSNLGEIGNKVMLATFTDDDFNSQLNAGYAISSTVSLALNYAYSYFYRTIFDVKDPDKRENRYPKSLTKQQLGFAVKFDPSAQWSTTVFAKYYALQTKSSKEVDFGNEQRRIEATRSEKENLGYGLASTYFVLPNLQVKASYEHAYRMPWPDEIFGDGLAILPSPDLGPEQSDNLNVGAAYEFKLGQENRFNLESSFIYREASDMIHRPGTSKPQNPFLNLADARTLGVEGSFKYNWREFLNVGGSITYQHITDEADSVYNESFTATGWQKNWQKGYRLPNTPYLFGNATVGFTAKNLLTPESVWKLNYYFNFSEQYFLGWTKLDNPDPQYLIPRQFSHNLELACSLKNGKYNVAAECRNFLDARLYDKYFLQKPGRAFYLKLRYVL
ncbi:TonB-dependent receptor [Adhaeribacter sp. BT258]|uniref:TonB-dependent receptor n=1 Tax=Adhaeribacter terrigena TaxID=2793070 RepID=A0ABS1C1W3_9BACT|nr:TonB-dependent receptor [Adhaeribacter terrigena]MBK0403375.1 TonB-dependent receptor [Adhaeribacter terrigena]